MLRFMLIFGLFLVIASVGLLMLALLSPADSVFGDAFESLFCQPNEELVRELGASTYDPLDDRYERSLTVYCEAPSGSSKEVTLQYVTMSGIVFVVLLLLGLSITIFASKRLMRRRASQMISGMVGQGVVIRTGQGQPPLNPKAAEMLAQMLGATSIPSATSSEQAKPEGGLAEKLEELEDARRKGLIREAEYYTMRQAILREFGE